MQSFKYTKRDCDLEDDVEMLSFDNYSNYSNNIQEGGKEQSSFFEVETSQKANNQTPTKLFNVLHPVMGYSSSHIFKKTPYITQAEARLRNDLNEFGKKRMTTGDFQVKISNYIPEETTGDFSLVAEFVGLFKLMFIFHKDYPYSPPSITYLSGEFTDIFDMEQNIKLPCLSLDKWSPVLSLNSLLFSIELLLIDQGANFIFYKKTRKKKFWEYQNENKIFYDCSDMMKKMKIQEDGK